MLEIVDDVYGQAIRTPPLFRKQENASIQPELIYYSGLQHTVDNKSPYPAKKKLNNYRIGNINKESTNQRHDNKRFS